MNTKRNELIICPKCHREYLPAEIFIPKAFFGNPNDIIRDVYGEILEFSGTGMDLNESYTCDTCNTTFNVTAKINFQISISNFVLIFLDCNVIFKLHYVA